MRFRPLNKQPIAKRSVKAGCAEMTTPCEHGKLDFEQCPDCRGWNQHSF